MLKKYFFIKNNGLQFYGSKFENIPAIPRPFVLKNPNTTYRGLPQAAHPLF